MLLDIDCLELEGVILPLEMCEPPPVEVCCDFGQGFQILLDDECAAVGGHVVSMDLCVPPPVDICCWFSDGYFAVVPSDECVGEPWGDPAICDELVCCMVPGAPSVIVPLALCPDTAVYDIDACPPVPDVCCQFEDGTLVLVPDGQCPTTMIVDLLLCAQTADVCCLLPSGAHVVISAAECAATIPGAVPGEILGPAALCDELVCCEVPGAAPMFVPLVECPALGVLDPDACEPPPVDVCCLFEADPFGSEGWWDIVPVDLCPGQWIDAEMCFDRVCCELDGTFAELDRFECPAMHEVPMEYCAPPVEMVCCLDADGFFDIVPIDECPGAEWLTEEECAESVCCELEGGVMAEVPQSECPIFAVMPSSACDVQLPCANGCDLGGWVVIQENSQQVFMLPAESVLFPGTCLVLGRNAGRADFEAFWGFPLPAGALYVNSGNKLPQINGDEVFSLLDPAGALVDGPTIPQLSGHNYQRIGSAFPAEDLTSWAVADAADAGVATPGIGPPPVSGAPLAGPFISEFSDAMGSGNYVNEFVEICVDGPMVP